MNPNAIQYMESGAVPEGFQKPIDQKRVLVGDARSGAIEFEFFTGGNHLTPAEEEQQEQQEQEKQGQTQQRETIPAPLSDAARNDGARKRRKTTEEEGAAGDQKPPVVSPPPGPPGPSGTAPASTTEKTQGAKEGDAAHLRRGLGGGRGGEVWGGRVAEMGAQRGTRVMVEDGVPAEPAAVVVGGGAGAAAPDGGGGSEGNSRLVVCRPDFIDRVDFADAAAVRFSVDGVATTVVPPEENGLVTTSCSLLAAEIGPGRHRLRVEPLKEGEPFVAISHVIYPA